MRNSAADIRRANTFDVIRAIHALPAATRKVIAIDNNLSVATVSNIVADLIGSDLVREIGMRRHATGRPTAQLALNPDHGILLGVDIAETYVHVETFDSSLGLLSSTELPLDPQQNGARSVAAKISEAISQELNGRETRSAPMLGIGVSAPGQVDQAGGTSVFAPNWDWHNVPLLALLRKVIDAPLILDNPLKAITIAELWSESGRIEGDFAVLNIGTGVGAGIAIDGKVYRGRTNSAGEWGHTVIIADGRACRCGSRGCIESYIGAPGIMQSIREIAPESSLITGGDQTATIHALREALDDGDPVAAEVLERTAHFLGIGIANLVNVLNPERVVLGGWVVDALGEHLLDAARPHLDAHALATPALATRLDIQKIAGNAVSLGAATLAFESYYLESMKDDPYSERAASSSQPNVASVRHETQRKDRR